MYAYEAALAESEEWSVTFRQSLPMDAYVFIIPHRDMLSMLVSQCHLVNHFRQSIHVGQRVGISVKLRRLMDLRE